jgi:hypothetical protein
MMKQRKEKAKASTGTKTVVQYLTYGYQNLRMAGAKRQDGGQ